MDDVRLEVEVVEDVSNSISENFQDNDQIKNLGYEVVNKIKNNVGLSMEVIVKPYNTIPRSEGGKLSRIKDLRNVWFQLNACEDTSLGGEGSNVEKIKQSYA